MTIYENSVETLELITNRLIKKPSEEITEDDKHIVDVLKNFLEDRLRVMTVAEARAEY